MRCDRLDVVFFAPHLGSVLASANVSQAALPGGAERQILLLARGLASRGWKVGLVAYEENRGTVPAQVDGVQIFRLPRPSSQARRSRRALAYLLAFGRLVTRLRTRVIVQRAAGAETGLVALAARVMRVRFVYSSAHNDDFDFRRQHPDHLTLRAFHLGIMLADTVVVQTHEQAELCRARFGRQTSVIRSIVEPASQRAGAGSAFLWVGRLVQYKDPGAFLALARRLPQARFRMVAQPGPVGQEALARRIEAECDALANIELTGPRRRDQLEALMDDAVAVVNTSPHEGMSNVVLEAWSRGVPALALAHDPDRLIETHGLGGFAGGSAEHLVELTATCWDTRGDQRDIAQRCRRQIAREHLADAVLKRWEEALGLTDAPGTHGPCAAGR